MAPGRETRGMGSVWRPALEDAARPVSAFALVSYRPIATGCDGVEVYDSLGILDMPSPLH